MDTARKAIAEARSLKVSSFPEVDDIRKDLQALKDDSVQLGQHVVSEGREKLSQAAATASQIAKDEYQHLSKTAIEKERMLESYVKDHPMRGIATAFLAGFVISLAMRK